MSRAEKFIENYTRNCSNELCAAEDKFGKKVISYHEWLTPDQARRAVEIARKEMIEKVCEFLDLHCDEVKTEDNGIAGWIDNFRKAMKDE